MKWIIVSDNHGDVMALDRVMLEHRDADGFIHCGDSEQPYEELADFYAVMGNNDIFDGYPSMLKIAIGTYKALVIHGHMQSSFHRIQNLAGIAKDHKCDLVFYGHSHIFADDMVDGIRLMNPGSLHHNRDGKGKTYGILEIDKNHVIRFIHKPYLF